MSQQSAAKQIVCLLPSVIVPAKAMSFARKVAYAFVCVFVSGRNANTALYHAITLLRNSIVTALFARDASVN